MTTWIIHTAGDADLGLPGHGDEESRRQWREQRLRQVAHASTRELADLLGLLSWRDQLPRADDAVAAPLVSILTGYSGPAPTVLIVGTRGGHPLGTYPIAETLAGAIGDVPDLYGRPATARAVAAATLDEDAVCAAVGEALRDATRGDEVVVAWGSGATLVALGAMAAVAERRLTWWLSLTGRDGQRHDLVPEDSPDRLVPWLLRLRYPDAVLETFGGKPEVVGPDKLEMVARLAERRRAGLLARDRDAVAALVLDAIARPDGTAGLAVRRYIDLEYRNRLEPGHPNRLDWAERQLRKDNEGRQPVLGACLEYIKRKRGRELTPSTRWLHSDPVDALNEMGKASHTLKRPTARQLARLASIIRVSEAFGSPTRVHRC